MVATGVRQTMMHALKCWPVAFERLQTGEKTFDVRMDDRGFQFGDIVMFREYDPDRGHDDCGDQTCSENRFTGRALYRQIGFVAKGDFFGLRLSQYAILSLVDTNGGDARLGALTQRVEHLESQVHELREAADAGYLEDEATRDDPDGGLG